MKFLEALPVSRISDPAYVGQFVQALHQYINVYGEIAVSHRPSPDGEDAICVFVDMGSTESE